MRKNIFVFAVFITVSLVQAKKDPKNAFKAITFKSTYMQSNDTSIPMVLFHHGLGATYTHAHVYQQFFCTPMYRTFNFPDAPEGLLQINHHTGLAQTTEIEYAAKALASIDNDERHCYGVEINDVVLYGVSRGASVIINVMAHKAYHPKDISVKAMILESPFAQAEDCIKNFSMPRLIRFFAERFFKEYNKHINRPIDAVAHLSRDVPILLVCAKDDAIVPCESTMMLYETLINKYKRDNVYLYCVETGVHGNICHSEENGDEYLQVVHAFYKEYGLPHDTDLAAKGALRFAQC